MPRRLQNGLEETWVVRKKGLATGKVTSMTYAIWSCIILTLFVIQNHISVQNQPYVDTALHVCGCERECVCVCVGLFFLS